MYKVWVLIFSLSVAITLWFTTLAVYEFWGYHRLNAQTSFQEGKWSVREKSPSQFFIEVAYTYAVDGVVYPGTTLFKTSPYPNPQAARLALPSWEKRIWKVWYVESRPEISSLQKTIPMKTIVHAILTWGISIYFYLLRRLEKSSWVRALKTPKSKRL